MELLQKINNYENEYVVKCFLRNFKMEEAEAVDIFNETKKWLYLSNCVINKSLETGEKIVAHITSDMKMIDDMWHTFILCTKDYFSFPDLFTIIQV